VVSVLSFSYLTFSSRSSIIIPNRYWSSSSGVNLSSSILSMVFCSNKFQHSSISSYYSMPNCFRMRINSFLALNLTAGFFLNSSYFCSNSLSLSSNVDLYFLLGCFFRMLNLFSSNSIRQLSNFYSAMPHNFIIFLSSKCTLKLSKSSRMLYWNASISYLNFLSIFLKISRYS
jgi:hypothetical protein